MESEQSVAQKTCFTNYISPLRSGNCPMWTFEMKNEKCVLS